MKKDKDRQEVPLWEHKEYSVGDGHGAEPLPMQFVCRLALPEHVRDGGEGSFQPPSLEDWVYGDEDRKGRQGENK